MSSRLIDAGYSLSVYNRTKSKGEAVVAKGAIWCDTPRQVAESSDIIFTIVGYPKDVEEVYLGKDGLIEGASSGKIFCDMTTTKPSLDIMIASRLAEKGAHMDVETVPTGALSLDLALGLGGIPKGRIIEIYGPESSGKTTVTLHMVAEVQKRGGIAGFIDAEHALDPVYARNIGVDIDNLYISQPDNGEQALEIAETMVRSGAVDIIVIDSVAALVPKAEIDGDMGDTQVGLHARLMSKALRKLTAVISKSNCIVIFINQLREKVGVMFGSPETTTGGRALKFYSSVRMDIRRAEALKQNGEIVGNHTRVKIVKNKIAPPFKEAEFDIMFGKGISREGDVLDLAANVGIVAKSGAWYSYNDARIGQGRENAKQYLIENPQVMEEIDHKVRVYYGLIREDENGPEDDNKTESLS